DQAHEQADGRVEQLLGTDGDDRRGRRVNDVDVGGAQAGGNGGVFQTLEQTVVKLLIGLEFPLENVVADQELAEFSHLHFFLSNRPGEQFAPARGRQVIVLHS